MLYFAKGSEQTSFSNDEIREALFSSLDKLGKREKVLAIPPDFTRFHSQAGILTELTWQYYKDDLVDILPALGTHTAMTSSEIKKMFGVD